MPDRPVNAGVIAVNCGQPDTPGCSGAPSPRTSKIKEAFAVGNLDGNNTTLGVACTIKTVEQDTGIYLDHFVVVTFTGFKIMVAALGGVQECNTQAINC